METTVEIDLKEALTGWSRIVKTIDDRQINVQAGTPTQPGYEIRYPELGMPTRGKLDLIASVNAVYERESRGQGEPTQTAEEVEASMHEQERDARSAMEGHERAHQQGWPQHLTEGTIGGMS